MGNPDYHIDSRERRYYHASCRTCQRFLVAIAVNDDPHKEIAGLILGAREHLVGALPGRYLMRDLTVEQ